MAAQIASPMGLGPTGGIGDQLANLVGDTAYLDSEFQHIDTARGSDVPYEEGSLHHAEAARKKAEQDSILLANRIRLLRAEEEKTRKKIKETEEKTRQTLEAKRRNEERRLAKEAEEAERNATLLEARARQERARAEKQKKLLSIQRSLLEQKSSMSKAVKQEREVGAALMEDERRKQEADAAARAEQVRQALAAAVENRKMAEGNKLENKRKEERERAVLEDQARRKRETEIEKMEREEAELIARLQNTQAMHRAAHLQLEDAMRQGNSLGQGISRQASTPGQRFSAIDSTSNGGARPPRPRVAPGGSTAASGPPPLPTQTTANSRSARPSSSTRASSFGPQRVAQKTSLKEDVGRRSSSSEPISKRDPKSWSGNLSSCSTSRGTDSGAGSVASFRSSDSPLCCDVLGEENPAKVPLPMQHSRSMDSRVLEMPREEVVQRPRDATANGPVLDTPLEEDFDLAELLNS